MEMKEEWLMPGAVVPVDAETTAALVAEIKRLIGVVGGMALNLQPAQQGVDWEKLYRLEVKKKEALAAKYERDTGEKLTRIVPMAEQPVQQQSCDSKIGESETQSDLKFAGETQAQQQEPVAWMWMLDGEVWDLCSTKDRFQPMREGHVQVPLYTSPPAQRTWVGLTDEEIEKGRDQTFSINNPYCPCDSKTMRKAVRWAEAKLKEKNT